MDQPSIYFLKLGGSLITDKSTPHTPRLDVLTRLAEEIAAAFNKFPNLGLVLGHGSGSFGHVPAKRYATRQGVQTPEQWRGFAEVWYEATALTRIVVEALHGAGLPVMAISPSACVTSRDRQVDRWDLSPLRSALDAALLPVIHGDVVFDCVLGGTILSTEDLFEHLSKQLRPARVLLAGIEEGVWADYPTCRRLFKEVTPGNLAEVIPALGGSAQTDVTGGMLSKVQQSLAMASENPGMVVRIFSGEKPGNVRLALEDAEVGTALHV